MPGNRPKLNKKIQRSISEAVEKGLTQTQAAAIHGISPQTITAWLKKGANPRSTLYHNFRLAVERAREICAARHLSVIEAAASLHGIQGEGAEKTTVTVREGPGGVSKETKTERDPAKWAAWQLERRFGYGKTAGGVQVHNEQKVAIIGGEGADVPSIEIRFVKSPSERLPEGGEVLDVVAEDVGGEVQDAC